MFLSRFGNEAQLAFIDNCIEGAFEIFDIELVHARRMRKLIQRYSDLPMDLADASLVVLAEHLGHGRILSTDRRDFQVYRWNDRQPFENLLAIG